jgi:hypothetical protein
MLLSSSKDGRPTPHSGRLMLRRLIAVIISTACVVSMAGCASAWPFIGGPHDIRVTSVTHVNLKNEPALQWISPQSPPSILLTRVEFTTNTNLLALANKRDYNVSYVFGPCTKGGVQDTGLGGGYVYSGKLLIIPSTTKPPGYAEEVAKHPPFSYQVFARKIPPNMADVPMCLTLSGGNMMGGRIRSNVAVVPKATN